MEKLIVLESVALQPGGGVTIRLQKQLWEDDSGEPSADPVASALGLPTVRRPYRSDPHLFTVQGDQDDLEASLADLDAYLALNKWPKLAAADRKFILGQAGKDAVVQARALAGGHAQTVRAEADTAIAAARQEAAQQIEAADQRAQAAEGRAAALEAAQEADTRYAEPGS